MSPHPDLRERIRPSAVRASPYSRPVTGPRNSFHSSDGRIHFITLPLTRSPSQSQAGPGRQMTAAPSGSGSRPSTHTGRLPLIGVSPEARRPVSGVLSAHRNISWRANIRWWSVGLLCPGRHPLSRRALANCHQARWGGYLRRSAGGEKLALSFNPHIRRRTFFTSPAYWL